ncbi:MAG: ABC transporter permease [Oscillospiraceae bacterium]|jgi:ABC-type antimicrobial peptide transport system permease subunit
MKKLDVLIFGLMNFLRRKARSVLTVLGVVIGTVSVIVMISIGIGMQEGFKEQISQWSNIREITVMKAWESEKGDSDSTEDTVINYMDDIGFEQVKELSHISAATPRMYANFPVLQNKKEGTSSLQVQGISASDMGSFDYKILYGRALNEADIGTTNFVMSFNAPFYFGKLKDPVWSIEIEEGAELPFNPVDMDFSFVWDWSYGQGATSADAPKPKFYDGKCVGIIAQKEGGD